MHAVEEYRASTDMEMAASNPSRWAVVLSGGEGRRMSAFVEESMHKACPKQYCTFTGTRSMLQHTLDRAMSLLPPQSVIVSTRAGQRAYLNEALAEPFSGRILEQPFDRGTFAAVFSSVACVLAEDAEATILITPSDGCIRPESEFLTYASLAILYAEHLECKMVMLGAVPRSAETDYGWIEPAGSCLNASDRARMASTPVRGFHEKPSEAEAEALMRKGCMWNTMIGAVKAKALWMLGWLVAPEAMKAFEWYRNRLAAGAAGPLSPGARARDLEILYDRLPTLDFSRDLLQRCARHMSVLPMHDVYWTDWGRPERVESELAAFRSEEKRVPCVA